LGVTIDLINPDAYSSDPVVPLSLEDEKLVEEENQSVGLPRGLDDKRSRQHNKVVPWLKKTEYISTEFNRYGVSNENNETKVGYSVQKRFKDDREKFICLDKEGQIQAINKTFEETKKPITFHHSKKGLVPVEILPVFPDFEFWKMPFAQVSFDVEPVNAKTSENPEQLMSEAMIRGVEDAESGEQFVAYFLPTEETFGKRKRDAENDVQYDPEEEYEYKQTREYTWSVKNKSTRGYDQNYFFVLRDGCFFYNELETRVRLTKRRNKGVKTTAKLLVKHRELTDNELNSQLIREYALKPSTEVEEEEAPIEPRDGEESQEDNNVEGQSPAARTSTEEDRGRKPSTSSSSSSGSSSSSESSSESEDDDKEEAKRVAEEIFGSDDDDSS